MRPKRAAELLNIDLRYSIVKEDVLWKFRSALREAHPDAGGKGGDMAELKKARDTLLAYVEEKAKIKSCPHRS